MKVELTMFVVEEEPKLVFPLQFCSLYQIKELLTCPLPPLSHFKLHDQKGDLLAQLLHTLLSVQLKRCHFCNIYLRFIIKMKTWFHTKNRQVCNYNGTLTCIHNTTFLLQLLPRPGHTQTLLLFPLFHTELETASCVTPVVHLTMLCGLKSIKLQTIHKVEDLIKKKGKILTKQERFLTHCSLSCIQHMT